MAHDHHHHEDRNSYYLNQLFTIAVCGALGGVAIMLWYTNKLALMLHPKFFNWVLAGGFALLILVLIRAVAVWRSVDGATSVPDHTHDHHHHHHDHDHEHCGHEHGHCHHEHGIKAESQTTALVGGEAGPIAAMEEHLDHDHGHGHDHGHDHDHGFAPWRYVVLLLPVVLYFLNLPNQIFSADVGGDPLKGLNLDAPTAVVKSTGSVKVGFGELQQASLSPESRDYYEGKNVSLTGMYYGNDPKRFTLRRYKINCCAGDAVPLNAIIMVDPNSSEKVDPDLYRNQWVEVHGRISFLRKPGTNEYLTALILYPTEKEKIKDLVSKIPVPSQQWLN